MKKKNIIALAAASFSLLLLAGCSGGTKSAESDNGDETVAASGRVVSSCLMQMPALVGRPVTVLL
jgi:PBP1b-binding outer membrane lipoprotein LpoB